MRIFTFSTIIIIFAAWGVTFAVAFVLTHGLTKPKVRFKSGDMVRFIAAKDELIIPTGTIGEVIDIDAKLSEDYLYYVRFDIEAISISIWSWCTDDEIEPVIKSKGE